jgi:hypothetical protein
MEGIGHKLFSAGKISVAPNVDDDRRPFGAEPCIKIIW